MTLTRRIAAIGFIFLGCTFAWTVLGGSVTQRTHAQSTDLSAAVDGLWGGPQVQPAPRLERPRQVMQPEQRVVTEGEARRVVTEQVERTVYDPVPVAGTDIAVDVALEHRRKGLLWHPTYRVRFDGRYRLANTSEEAGTYRFAYQFPPGAAVYDNVVVELDGERADAVPDSEGWIVQEVELEAGQTRTVRVGYGSQGSQTWTYSFGQGVAQLRDFTLAMTTDFDAVDFPPGTLSPSHKEATEAGWALTWAYGTLVAEGGVGMQMPQRLNPGPWVSRVTFFAPVSLLLFFFVLSVLALLRGVRLHPMHYFFLGAAFFAFHLLLAYLVDHVPVAAALAICSAVSVGLVVSYMRLVTGGRFALVDVGLAQLVYLVGFAYTFFLEGFVGLAVAGLSVATLFIAMQATGRLDWEALFRDRDRPGLAAEAAGRQQALKPPVPAGSALAAG